MSDIILSEITCQHPGSKEPFIEKKHADANELFLTLIGHLYFVSHIKYSLTLVDGA